MLETIRACVFVEFNVKNATLLVQRRETDLLRLWPLEVECSQRDAGWLNETNRRPLAYCVLLFRPAMKMKADVGIAVNRCGAGGIITQYELMTLRVMRIVVVHSGRFPAPVQIIAVGFIKLTGVGHGNIVAVDLKIPHRVGAVIAENAARLVAQVRVVEQVAVFSQGQVA